MSPMWILLTLLPILGGAVRFNCKGRILGAYYADAKSGCKAFHVCVRVAGGGIRDFRFFCPPGTLFHTEAQTCTDWGDDDPLACPADLYDGQFDLYKIGSGYDTRMLSSSGNRDDEAEFGLQRAETGDRRLSQNNAASNGPASDLRAAHSSDFFSGQRDRGRDELAPSAPSAPASTPYPRQSFRRATTPRATAPTTQYTPAPTFPPQSSSPPQYEVSKRKLVRKRPLYKTTAAPTTPFVQNTPPQKQYSQPQQQQHQAQQYQPQHHQQQQQQHQQQHQPQQQQPQLQQPQQHQPQQHQPQQQPQQQYFNRRIQPQNRQSPPTAPPNVPPQYSDYKDEYVEVSRVTPKQNRYFASNPTSAGFSQTTPAPQSKTKDGLVEIYNYEAQSTPGLNVQNDNRPFKVRNSFSVADVPREPDFVRTKNLNNNFNNVRASPTTTVDYNVSSRGAITSTPAYKNYNSVSYESDKNNFIPFSKQNNFNSPTTTPQTTTIYTTVRSDPPLNLNTVAYNTNNAFHTQSNFAESVEDDGQYRPPQGEDDGQYRPELYDRELLTGAHSLNIAASGNRLPEDQKPRGKTQPPPKHSHTAVPRPFRPAPTSSAPVTQTTKAVETYPTTVRPAVKTQRTFDYYQTYTTTSRPSDIPEAISHEPVRQTTTAASRSPDTRPTTPAPRPSTRPHQFANPPKNKEDSSYDYAYYDSDPGFSEYDHIEEFGRTKTRV